MNWKYTFFATLMFCTFLINQTTEVALPTLCEVCKYLTVELQSLLSETEKSKFVLETGHGLDTKKKKIQYQYSELRLTEALHEPHICDRLLKYSVHNEKKGSLRFAKGRSETLKTLHGLREKGVKVDLGIPEDLWDTPSVEVSDLHRKCIRLVEDHETDIEDWYFGHQATQSLQEYLCKDIVLLPNESVLSSNTLLERERKLALNILYQDEVIKLPGRDGTNAGYEIPQGRSKRRNKDRTVTTKH